MGIVVLQPTTMGMPQSQHTRVNDYKEYHGMNTLHVSALPTRTQPAEFDVSIIQYASGRIEARPLGTQRFTNHIGFHSECGVDAAFDEAMAEAGFARIEIRHPRDGKDPETRTHWNLGEKLGMWPLCAGPAADTATKSSMPPYAERTANAGLGLRWEHNKSKLALRGYLFQLVRKDYVFPVQLTVRSRMTDRLLDALHDHLAVCEHADRLVNKEDVLARDLDEETLAQLRQQGHTRMFAFYELLLPLKVGAEESFGRAIRTSVSPLVSAHPEALAAEYIQRIWRPAAILEAVGHDWEATVAWAHLYARPYNPETPTAALPSAARDEA